MLNKQKKYLGQHFLNNKKILEEMARSAEISKKDTVLEVGPGLGSLTEILAERAGKVIAVEKDRDLVPLLQEKFSAQGRPASGWKNVKIIQGDILKLSPESLKLKKYKIVANLPYYITSRFLRIFLSDPKLRPKLMVLMIQKEVADRILARDKKESLLSLSVKAYAEPKLIRKVPRGAFSPPPKVDSAILKLSIFTSPPPLLLKPACRTGREGTQEKILQLAKIAFKKKRKMLRHSIGKKIKLPEKYQTKRPEELSLEDWAEIVVK